MKDNLDPTAAAHFTMFSGFSAIAMHHEGIIFNHPAGNFFISFRRRNFHFFSGALILIN